MICRLTRDVEIRGFTFPKGYYLDSNFKYYRMLENNIECCPVEEALMIPVSELNTISLLKLSAENNCKESYFNENSGQTFNSTQTLTRKEKIQYLRDLGLDVKSNISNVTLDILWEEQEV